MSKIAPILGDHKYISHMLENCKLKIETSCSIYLSRGKRRIGEFLTLVITAYTLYYWEEYCDVSVPARKLLGD